MNPYLEQSTFWSSFHFRLIGAIAAAIEPQLSLHYYVDVETRTYQSDDNEEDVLIGIPDAAVLSRPTTSASDSASEPALPTQSFVATQSRPERVSLPVLMPIHERYLEVREAKTNAVITVIEVLSPKNKRTGEGRNAYEKKRRMILESATHLVEIDLLRAGTAMPILGQRSPSAYRILVSRSPQRPAADLYSVTLQQPLPIVPIPLKAEESDVLLDLQAAVDRVYEEARYSIRIDYQQPVPPPA
jgi:Protein of unknown function (DUF4058)